MLNKKYQVHHNNVIVQKAWKDMVIKVMEARLRKIDLEMRFISIEVLCT